MAGKIKGITIEIGGNTTTLQAALKNAKNEGKDAASEISKINNALKFNPNSVELLGQKVEVLKDRVSSAGNELDALKAAQKAVDEQFKKGDMKPEEYREFQRNVVEAKSRLENFQKQLENAQSEYKNHSSKVGTLKDSFNGLKEKIDDVKEKHSKLITVLSKTGTAAKNLASGGLKVLGGVASGAAAGVTAVETAAVAAGKELYDMAKETAAVGDNIDKMSQRLGLSAEAYQEWEYVLSQSGVEIDRVQTGMKTLTNTIDDAKNGADKAITKFERLGITQKDLANKSREEIFAKTISGLQQMTDDTEKAALANDLFGKSGQEIIPLLNQSSESTEALIQKAHDLGLIMSDEAVQASVAFTDSLDSLNRATEGVKNRLSAEFLPGITEVIDGLTGLLTGDEGAPELIQKGFEDIGGKLEELLPQVLTMLGEFTGPLAEIAPDIIFSISNGLLDNLDTFTQSAFDIIQTLAEGLLSEESIERLISSAVNLVGSLAQFLGNNAELIINAAFQMINSLINGLVDGDNIDKLVTASIDLIGALVTGMIDNADDVLVGAFKLIEALVGALLDYDWWGVAKKIFASIRDSLKNLISRESNKDNPEHAGGLPNVPYDGYAAELHEGERILTAAENKNYNRQQQERAEEQATINRRLDSLERSVRERSPTQINITAKGSARGIARSLKYYVDEEDKREGVIDKNKKK